MIAIDRNLATTILQDLVRIPSVNPDLVPGAPGEAAIAQHICGLMQSWGLEVVNREVAPGRHNAIGILRGTGGGRTLLFNGHMDTVSVVGMAEPYSGAVRPSASFIPAPPSAGAQSARQGHGQAGKLYGRGAFDMKGSLAATLAATHAICRGDPRGRSLRGDVIFTYVADEEYASIGTEGIVADIRAGRLPRPDAAINTEPSETKLGIGHKGFAWIEIETVGKAAHGSRPDLGVDAIVQMGKVLVEIDRLQARLGSGQRHALLGTGSIHASLIQGGRELSSYPDACALQVERRTVPPETEQQVVNEIGEIFQTLIRADPDFAATSRVTFVRKPWEADLQSEIAQTVSQSITRVTGKPPETTTFAFWADTALLADVGIPSIMFGPSGEGAHAVEEWVDVASLGVCAQVYADAMERFCG